MNFSKIGHVNMMGMGRRSRRTRPSEDREIPNTPVNWRRLFSFLAPYKARMAIAIIALTIYSTLGLVFPLVIGQLLVAATPQQAAGSSPDFSRIDALALELVVLFLVQASFTFIQSFNIT